jgi:hypothetical protein
MYVWYFRPFAPACFASAMVLLLSWIVILRDPLYVWEAVHGSSKSR